MNCAVRFLIGDRPFRSSASEIEPRRKAVRVSFSKLTRGPDRRGPTFPADNVVPTVAAGIGGSQMTIRFAVLTAAACLLSACVHKADLDLWQGVPVAELDKHPFFLTVPAVRTRAADGTEIRNYVNGQNVASCSGGGSVFASSVDLATYSSFTSCMQQFAACNNIFYIKDGVVQQYIATGTGGARCMTNEQLRPGFKGSSNF